MKRILLPLLILCITIQACQSQEHEGFGATLLKKMERVIVDTGCQKDSFGIEDCSRKILRIYQDSLLADGFDFPIGDKNGKGSYTSTTNGKVYTGWYKAVKFPQVYALGIHPGEDWNGNGGGDTDLGQPVYSPAIGKVIFAQTCASPWGKVIVIEHRFLENGKVRKVYSQYAHLQEMLVKKGDIVKRRQQIAKIGKGDFDEYPAHLHFEIRKYSLDSLAADYWPSSHNKTVEWVKANYENPTEFIKKHRKLKTPKSMPQLVIAVKSSYKLLFLKYGKLQQKYEIALSQNPKGHKVKQGDLKLPEGAYRLCQKSKGPFTGSAISAFFGPAWMRVSYPNNFDAAVGLKNGLIKKWQYNTIVQANNARKTPPKNTALGGGIGIHGWAPPGWENDDDRHLTWGCISMHNDELETFFEAIELNCPIFILP
ncbi:MAG: peptidoglycan DD-metalloendopeptidase family protein [Flammeovirgaceae bacterium]